jgi:hypothetical protein
LLAASWLSVSSLSRKVLSIFRVLLDQLHWGVANDNFDVFRRRGIGVSELIEITYYFDRRNFGPDEGQRV